MKKEKRIDYILQLIMVILGVFLGMMVSNWSVNKNQEKDKQSLLIGLRSEIQQNLNYLIRRKEKDIIPFFNSLDSLSKVSKTDQGILEEPFKNQFNQILNFPGLGKPRLDDAMFEATKYSNMLSSFDIELLQQLTKSYILQYNIEETRRLLDQRFLNINYNTKLREVEDLMWITMEEYFGAQYNLIAEYQKTLNLIDKILN